MSDKTQVSVKAKCRACGERVTWLDTDTGETVLICKKCGTEFGTLGDFKRKSVKMIGDKIRDDLKNIFKRR